MNENNNTEIKVGSTVWVDDGYDSGFYEVRSINEEKNDCWVVGYDIGQKDRTVEQQLPLNWVKKLQIKSED